MVEFKQSTGGIVRRGLKRPGGGCMIGRLPTSPPGCYNKASFPRSAWECKGTLRRLWAQSARLHSHAERGSEHDGSRSHAPRGNARGRSGVPGRRAPVYTPTRSVGARLGYRFGTRSTGSVRGPQVRYATYRTCVGDTRSVRRVHVSIDNAQHPCVAHSIHASRTTSVVSFQ